MQGTALQPLAPCRTLPAISVLGVYIFMGVSGARTIKLFLALSALHLVRKWRSQPIALSVIGGCRKEIKRPRTRSGQNQARWFSSRS